MNRRQLIKMSDEETAEFLGGSRNAALTTIGSDGYPHTTAMWYGLLDGIVHFATYGKSQKVLNAQRNPRSSVLVEEGTTYAQLRGVLVQADCEVVEDADLAAEVLFDITRRYEGVDVRAAGEEAMTLVRQRASKRVVMRMNPVRVVTWDHSKLAGVY